MCIHLVDIIHDTLTAARVNSLDAQDNYYSCQDERQPKTVVMLKLCFSRKR